MADATREVVEKVFREEFGQAVATLIRLLGDFDLAEEAVQEAFVVAIQRWPATGVPDRPGAWITTTARNKAIDRLRRERGLAARQPALALLQAERGQEPQMHTIGDDRLRLIFTCCHPALSPEARVALTLRTLGGLSTPRSPAPSWSRSRPWPSDWSGPSGRSAMPASPIACRPTTCCRSGSARCWPSST